SSQHPPPGAQQHTSRFGSRYGAGGPPGLKIGRSRNHGETPSHRRGGSKHVRPGQGRVTGEVPSEGCKPSSGARAALSFVVFDVELEALVGSVSWAVLHTRGFRLAPKDHLLCDTDWAKHRDPGWPLRRLNRSQTLTAQKCQFGTHLKQPRRRGTAAHIGGSARGYSAA